MATIRSLNVSVKANVSPFEKSIRRAIGLNKSFAASALNATRAVAAIGSGAALAAGTGLAALAKESFASIDAAAKLAERSGDTVDAIRSLGHVAGLAGSSTETLAKSIEQMQRRLGSGEAEKALRGMGLSANELIQMAPTEAFKRIADGIKGLGNEAQRADTAYQIFGRSGQELLNTLNQGSASISAQQKEFIALRGSINSVQSIAIQNANDAVSRLWESVKGLGDRAAVALAPFVDMFATKLSKSIAETGYALGNLNPIVDSLTQVVAAGADALELFAAGWNSLRTIADKVSATLLRAAAGFASLGSIRRNEKTGLFERGEMTDLEKHLNRMADMAENDVARSFDKAATAYERFSNGVAGKEAAKAIEALRAQQKQLADEAERTAAALAKQREFFKGIAGPQSFQNLANPALPNFTPDSFQNLAGDNNDQFHDMMEQMKAFRDVAQSAFEDTRLPMERYLDRVNKLREAFESGAFDEFGGLETLKRAMDQALDTLKRESESADSKEPAQRGMFRELNLAAIDPAALATHKSKPQEVMSPQLEAGLKIQRDMLIELRALNPDRKPS